MRNSLTLKAGGRQKILLFELYYLGIISFNMENDFWQRGALTSKFAKSLLDKNDKTLDEQIKDIEPFIIRLEQEAANNNHTLNGSARKKLDSLYKLKQEIKYEL